MSNDYLPDLPQLLPGDIARSADVNERYENAVAGFDRLPAPAVGKQGFSAPVPVGEPTDADHAVTKNWAETSMTSQVQQATTQATNAANSASAAATSESNAAASEANAASSETNAAGSASAASASQSAAANSESMAQEWAENPEDIAITGNPGKYSALHHAAKALASKNAAATSETNAANSAAAAAISESNAASSESNAATSEANAATSETNAAASAAAAAASLDSFDDRYLGPKASDPTLDNDGNALLTGALYWNSTSQAMKVYSGSVWTALPDETAAGLLTKLLTVDGAGSGLDADLLQGLAPSQLLRSDQGGTLSGNLTVTGEASSDTLTFTRSKNLAALTDLDTVTTSGFYDVNDPVNGPGSGWWYLFVQRHVNTNGYCLQRAWDLNDNNGGAWERKQLGGVWGAWYKVWNGSNDGVGSGLDADLLAGVGSGSYARRDASNTFTAEQIISYNAPMLRFHETDAVADEKYTRLLQDGGNWDIRFYNDAFSAYTSPYKIFRDGVNIGDQVWRIGADVEGMRLSSSGVLTVLGNQVLTVANEGSGKGIDADSVDGVHASQLIRNDVLHQSIKRFLIDAIDGTYEGGEFVLKGAGTYPDWSVDVYKNSFRILRDGSTRFEVDPTNSATGMRFLGNTVWHSANDGAGSGLDADKLDGIESGSFLRSDATDAATGRIDFQAAPQAGGIADATGSLGSVEVSGDTTRAAMMCFHRSGSYAGYFGLDTDNKFKVGGWSFGNNAYELWHSGNQGAGSGLDADKLDGLQASSFMRSDASTTTTGNLTASGGSFYVKAGSAAANSHFWLQDDAGKNEGLFYWDRGTDSIKIRRYATDGSTVDGEIEIKSTEITANKLFRASGDIKSDGDYYWGDNKAIVRFNDSWLRLNDRGDFTSGIYCGGSILRTDGELQVNSNGGAFYAKSSGHVKASGTGRFAHLSATDGAAALLFDGDPGDGFGTGTYGPLKRITCNDGGSNFAIRAGSYYSTGDKYAANNEGAADINFSCDGTNGRIELRVAANGGASGGGTAISYAKSVVLTTTDFTYGGDPITHAGQAVGAVGTYAFAETISGSVAAGATVAGSNLYYSNHAGSPDTSQTLPGTWRCMGHCSGSQYATLFLRIS